MWPSASVMYQELITMMRRTVPQPSFWHPLTSGNEPVWQIGSQCLNRRARPKEERQLHPSIIRAWAGEEGGQRGRGGVVVCSLSSKLPACS